MNVRPGFRLDFAVAALFAVLSASFILHDLMTVRHLVLPGEVMIGRDFANAWAGGRLTLLGRVGEIYSSNYMAALDELTGRQLSVHAFSYPPTALLFLWPLGIIPYVPALALFLLMTGAAFFFAARPYCVRAGLPPWAAVLLPASLINVWAGHYGFLFSALWLTAFSGMEKRPLRTGALLTLLTFKPHMGMLIPLLLLLRREWKVIVAAVGGTLALLGVSLLLFGGGAWITYLTATASLQTHLLAREHAFFFSMMPTAYSTFWQTFGNMPLAILAQCVCAVAAIFVIVRAAQKAIDWAELGLMTATATFLVLPYAFNYDMGVVGLGAAILLFDRKRQLDLFERMVALIALGAPVLVLMLSPIAVPILPLSLLGFLWVQARAYGVWHREPAPFEAALAR
jgi:hypothetical protein